jgi:tetratricopeptide (TPR) repeat protein
LLSLFDKRTGVELLSSGPLLAEPGDRRGASLTAGIELHLDGRERLTSLGGVFHAPEEPDDERPAGLWLSEAVTGTGLSWHLHVTLPDDRAEIQIEGRVFNRTQAPLAYSAGLVLPGAGEALGDGRAWWAGGVAVVTERERWHGALRSDGALFVSRFEEALPLAPHQLDTWRLSLIPFSGLPQLSAASRAGVMRVDGTRLKVQGAEPLLKHKVVILSADGETLEAPVQIHPEKALEMELPAEPRAVALMDDAKNVVLQWDAARPPVVPKGWSPPAVRRFPVEDLDTEAATFQVSSRHIAHARHGARALAAQDYDEAEYRFEQALLYNGEDHLTWWLKAAARRLRGERDDEQAELLNAHYLAPLEPALRAESFLSQPQSMEREPSPILKPLDEFPEAFVEVAALLLEAGLFEQAGRWIDESLRHADLPILRYLLAYAHLKASGLDMEAAEQLSAAARQPLSPPFPWRRVELEAIRTLRERFPGDERLAAFGLYGSLARFPG